MSKYTCALCGTTHDEMPTCFISDLPLYAAQIPDAEKMNRIDRSSDQCVVDNEHFFILGNLDVYQKGMSEFLRWTVWTSLSLDNFRRATDLWETAGREQEPPYFSWLSNQIPGYSWSVNIKARVHTMPVGVRPRIEVIDPTHDLHKDQINGIAAERFHELIHAALHV